MVLYPLHMSVHTVIFVRHAEAAQDSSAGDAARNLSEAGKAQAQELGRKLAETLKTAGQVLSSPAQRAVETWGEMLKGADIPADHLPQVQEDPVIYAGDAQGILNAVRFRGEGETVVVIGHEPTISEAARLSVKEGVDVPAGLPTGSAVLVEASHDWKEWHSHVAVRAEFVKA